ncbi:hypothetical protein BVRB_3g056730 [Beta vulgaris subsp. vulgaris]|nr:hypothetical protein BVRB_3g056730 [Beta vulgaris subsp. vulgaris]
MIIFHSINVSSFYSHLDSTKHSATPLFVTIYNKDIIDKIRKYANQVYIHPFSKHKRQFTTMQRPICTLSVMSCDSGKDNNTSISR